MAVLNPEGQNGVERDFDGGATHLYRSRIADDGPDKTILVLSCHTSRHQSCHIARRLR